MAHAAESGNRHEVHRVVDLNWLPVIRFRRHHAPHEIVRALGIGRVQDASLWRSSHTRADLKIHRNPEGHLVPDVSPLGNGRWGLSVNSGHRDNWYQCDERETRVLEFLNQIPNPPGDPTWLVPQLRDRGISRDAVRWGICFRTTDNGHFPTRTELLWDSGALGERGSGHGLIIPRSEQIPLRVDIHEDDELTDRFSRLYGWLYPEDADPNDPAARGHWDEWQFCCFVQILGAAEPRDEVNYDPPASLLLWALDFVSSSCETASEQCREAIRVRGDLLEFAAAHTSDFSLEEFVRLRSADDKQLLLEIIKKFDESEPQDESLVAKVVSLLTATSSTA